MLGGYIGPNATTRNHLNGILTTIYKAKDDSIEWARIGVSGKAGRRISVIIKYKGSNDEQLIGPTFSHLSSGELMAFAIAATILREHDQLNQSPAAALTDIRGVVLIDEVDLHLHIRLQKAVLPALMALFPNVQYIVTTHSPFFLLGLAENTQNPHVIVRLPHGERIAAEEFVEFQQAYDTFIDKENQFKAAHDAVSLRLKDIEKPLLITEGKTDWQHMKAALTRLKEQNDYANLELDFHEYLDLNMGSATLYSMCEQFSKVPHARRVIFIFDRDEPALIHKVEETALGYKNWGNNVFSFCIPIPTHRTHYEKIAIELYYTDADLRTVDPVTGYRLVFSNEIQKVVEASLTNKGESKVSIRLRPQPVAEEEFQKLVYDHDCEKIVDANGNRLAHSKALFAQKVLSREARYGDFGIEPFRAIFDRTARILDAP